jgi:CHAD domain-containing protein
MTSTIKTQGSQDCPATETSPAAQGSPGASFEVRMATDRLRCLGYAKALEKAFRPETVHKLRTHLRRLQSYAEYLDRPKDAERLGEAVSWFSRLRTLDEFERYLRRLEVGAKDCRRAEKALRNEQEDVRKANRPAAVTLLLTNTPVARLMRPGEYIADRFQRLQPENRTMLGRGLQGLSSKPTRKELHRLRLLIKSLRYQQEIAVEMRWGNPRSVKALKRLQSILGKYTDRAQFVSLAKELNLSCQNKIKKDRRLSRKRARGAVLKLKSAQAHPLLPIRRSLTSV